MLDIEILGIRFWRSGVSLILKCASVPSMHYIKVT